ncbi:MAG: hypothetical protein K0S95_999 [Pantoea eucrina]|jgi:hypothetical protein|nr:hypothetical protein [Pantoea eucrina]
MSMAVMDAEQGRKLKLMHARALVHPAVGEVQAGRCKRE